MFLLHWGLRSSLLGPEGSPGPVHISPPFSQSSNPSMLSFYRILQLMCMHLPAQIFSLTLLLCLLHTLILYMGKFPPKASLFLGGALWESLETGLVGLIKWCEVTRYLTMHKDASPCYKGFSPFVFRGQRSNLHSETSIESTNNTNAHKHKHTHINTHIGAKIIAQWVGSLPCT